MATKPDQVIVEFTKYFNAGDTEGLLSMYEDFGYDGHGRCDIFFHTAGADYISCSTFGVPIALPWPA